MFPERQWNENEVNNLLKKIGKTGSIDRSASACSACTPAIVNEVEGLTLSQEEQSGTHSSQRQIARRTGISLGSVNTITKKDLRLRSLKKAKGQSLTESNSWHDSTDVVNCCAVIQHQW